MDLNKTPASELVSKKELNDYPFHRLPASPQKNWGQGYAHRER